VIWYVLVQAYARKLSSLVLEAVAGTLDGIDGAAKSTDSSALDLTGSREFLTSDTAEEALAPMLAPGSTVSWIKFSTKSFGVDAALVAAKAIRNVSSTLKHADLSDIIAGRPEDEALQSLRIISEALALADLDSLDLSDNALGEKGIRACAAVVSHQKNLKHIAFQNVGCSVHGCAAVNELLVHSGNLRSIHLLNNMSGCEGAASIAAVISRCPMLEEFKMASSRVGSDGGMALAKALATCGTNLRSIDLHDNPLTSEVAGALSEVILSHPQLSKINLNDTALEDSGIEKISLSLGRVAKNVKHLELEINEITPEGAAEIARAINQMENLEYLNLKENELEDDGALEIAKALLGLKKLETVDMRTNAIKRGGAVALAKACVTLPSMKELLLDDNEISENGIEALMDVLRKGMKESILGSLEENMPDEDDQSDFEDGHETLDQAVDELTRALEKTL
jgi:Ran GTPase-activating protein (RanGAP) involved in mRNA processing and transport